MAANDLTTLDNVKQYLEITSTNSDALLSRMITAASAFITSWLSRNFIQATYTETYNGSGSTTQLLRQTPIVSVSSLVVNTITVPPSPDGVQAGYVFDDMALYLIGMSTYGWSYPVYYFPRGKQNIKVTYTAGYATVPADVEQACIELVGKQFNRRKHLDVSNKNLGTEVVSYTKDDLGKDTQAILQSYARVVPL
jgi:uncharacterized phiE125 gp8 family phage protein